MSSPDRRQVLSHLLRASVVVTAAGLTAGCFQPLYGVKSAVGGPSVRDAMKSVSIKQIPAPSGTAEARLAVEIRNQLLFDLNGGSGNPPLPAMSLRQFSTPTCIPSLSIR